MSPTWAQTVASGLKSPRSQTNVTPTPKPTKRPVTSIYIPERFGKLDAIPSENHDRKHQPNDTNINRKETQEIEASGPNKALDKLVVMDQNTQDESSSRSKPDTTPERPDEANQERPSLQPEPTPIDAPTDAYVRISTDERKQIVDEVCSEILSDVRERIIDEYFRSLAGQNSMSYYICAEPFCREQIPWRCCKGRWASCESCGNKTCLMSSCVRLQRDHNEGGWEICPDGAAGLGLERIAREGKWKRCGRCHRFLPKAENDKTGKCLPCSHCADSKEPRR